VLLFEVLSIGKDNEIQRLLAQGGDSEQQINILMKQINSLKTEVNTHK